jgi:disulfide bond formation protein DsbB
MTRLSNVDAGTALPPRLDSRTVRTVWSAAAFLLALLGLAGSLYLSLGMALKPCPLCYYQRAFAMGLVGVLGMGLPAGVARAGRLGLLALPLAVAGLGVAAFHVWLEATGKLECPQGVLGLGTAPEQSLGVFAVLVVILVVDVSAGVGAWRWAGLLASVVLGGLLGFAACISNPPMPAAPPAPYPGPPDICRPPFVAT